MHLYHLPGSRSTRVLWTLEEIGAPYELTILTREEKRSDEHRERHPLGRVPVMALDDGQFVFESAAILLHLGDLHPEAGLLPPVGTTDRAIAYQWSVFAMSELESSVFGWVRARRAQQDEAEPAERFAQVAAALAEAVTDRPYLLGDTFTVADVLCASILGTAFRRGLTEDDGPLRAYVGRALERPANVRAEAVGR
ncbi:MAG: glutathione S-transferase [Solirubrobacterales bacterium]|jgi:glutathione S-transferase|nr:glutathione S-transferase [Solirubrobacterales bacterium]